MPFWDALLARYIGAARDRLRAEGRVLDFDDAVDMALGVEARQPGSAS